MLKKTILTLSTLLLMSGCVTKEVIYRPTPQTIPQQPTTQRTHPLKSHTFAGERLTASQRVSDLVYEIERLNNNTAYLEIDSNQNVQVGAYLNISVTPNRAGYLKIITIDPNGERSQVVPNFKHNGYLRANERFYTNNEKFALKATNPKGLHYVVILFSQRRVNLAVQQGMSGYNGLESDQDFINILQSINNQNYGKSYIHIFPMRIH
jgi:hypothetical protein